MKTTAALTAAAAVATAVSISLAGSPVANADELTTTTLGNGATLANGNVVQTWTVGNLKPSTDQIPYAVAGTLWEATATDQAVAGSVTPIVSNLNARAKSGQTYRVLFGAATPQGVNPATLGEGQKASGKVYFDVVGDNPDSVVYNAGGQDLLVWIQPPPQLPSPRGSGGYSSTAPSASAAPSTSAAPTTPATPTPGPAAPTTAAPAGSQGTPLPAGSQGTPLPAGATATPVPAEGSPQPASVPVPSAPTGSQGTPLPAGAAVTPAPAAPTTTVVVPPPA